MYDPYLDTLGGGERYMLTLASLLSKSHNVSLFWDDDKILQEANKKFGFRLTNLSVQKDIFSSPYNAFDRLLKMREFDQIFFLSDGSIPLLMAKKNILLFQFPISWRKSLSLYERLKLFSISKIIYNSEFVMRSNIKLFNKPGVVLYPPVPPIPEGIRKKENIILGVGRFTKGMNMKKQDVLISTFKEFSKKISDDWQLVLIGSVLSSDMDFLEKIKAMAKDSKVKLIINPSHEELVEYLQKAKIFWHAAGFGEDLLLHPERAEHFGIAVVEAMSAGCVPVVFNGGGPCEIVEDGVNGFLFDTPHQLIDKTILLINDRPAWKKLSDASRVRAESFSPGMFYQQLTTLL